MSTVTGPILQGPDFFQQFTIQLGLSSASLTGQGRLSRGILFLEITFQGKELCGS